MFSRPGAWMARCFFVWAFGPAMMALGCGGTETGNPPAVREVSMALVLRSTDAEHAQEHDAGPLPYSSITSAWITTDAMELQACARDDEARLPPLTWDLALPVPHKIQTGILDFCGIVLRTRLADASTGSIPPGMTGASLWIRALRNDGTPFEVRGEAELDIVRDSLAPLSGSRLSYAFDAAAWFRGVRLDGLSPDPDGIIRVSPASNPDLLQLLEGQIANGSELRTRESDDDVSEEEDD